MGCRGRGHCNCGTHSLDGGLATTRVIFEGDAKGAETVLSFRRYRIDEAGPWWSWRALGRLGSTGKAVLGAGTGMRPVRITMCTTRTWSC